MWLLWAGGITVMLGGFWALGLGRGARGRARDREREVQSASEEYPVEDQGARG